MEDIFKKKICSICQKRNTEFCNKNILRRQEKSVTIIYCNDYRKNREKLTK